MSIISNDKQALDGRKNTLKDAEVPIREQIVKKLYAQVKERNLPQIVAKAWAMESANIASQLERQKVYLQDLDQFLPSSSEGQSAAGSSNLHIPMPHIVSKAYVARFMEAIWNIDPPFSLKARRADMTDKQPLLEDFMRYVIYHWANHYKGLEEAVEHWVMDTINTGTGIMKMRWENEFCSYIDVQEETVPGPPKFEVDAEGNEVAVPTTRTVQKEARVTIPKFQGPVVEPVNLEDFVMVGGQGDPDKADLIIHRHYMTASELWSMADQELFDHDAVEQIIRGGQNNKSAGLNSAIKTMRAENAGRTTIDTDNDLDRYEILECYMKTDVDESGIVSDIVMWIGNQSRALLRSTYLYRISPTGERPFSVCHFQKRRDQDHATGLLEMLHPLSVELDAMHNIRLDFGMINNNPVFFYRASSSLNADELKLEPGMGIPLDNPQTDVFFPQRPNNTGFFGNEEQVIQTYIERLTGLSDINFGSMSGSQGASRTATGAKAMLMESNTNLNIHLRHFNRAWTKVLRYLYHMMQQKIDGFFVFRITGQDGSDVFRKISSIDLAYDVDFELTANSSNSNKAVQVELAQQKLQIASNPLYLQLGITDGGSIYEAAKELFQAYGVKDFNRIIKKPQGYEYMPSPEETFNRIVRGQEVRPNPRMDIDGIIAFFQTMLDQNQKQQILSPDQMRAAATGLNQFSQFKQAMEQQAAQQAVSQQMAANAALGTQGSPAPTDYNPQPAQGLPQPL
jgi:hypothetical protein